MRKWNAQVQTTLSRTVGMLLEEKQFKIRDCVLTFKTYYLPREIKTPLNYGESLTSFSYNSYQDLLLLHSAALYLGQR